MHDGRLERAFFVRQQGVDQQKAGSRLNEVLDVESARDWRQVELYRKQQDQQQAPPEDGHGIAGKRDTHDTVVKDRVASDRRQNAGRDADHQCKQDRAHTEFDRGRKQRQELLHHRSPRNDGFTQVTLQHADDVDAVLHQDGPVQPVFLEQCRVAHGVDAAFTGECFNRVARYQPYEEEDQQRHPDKRGNDQAQAGKDEA